VSLLASGIELDQPIRQHTWLFVGLVLLATLPLALRRVAPLVSVIAVMGAMVGLEYFEFEFGVLVLAMIVAIFSAGAYSRSTRESLAGLVAGLVWAVLSWLRSVNQDDLWIFFIVGMLGGIWLVGDTLRRRTARVVELEAHAADLERDREEASHQAVAEERARIARELHDVIAHSVSVMVVQAAAARRILDTQPEAARTSLEAIETTGREALAEMRRLLGVMRREDAADDAKAPQPGLGRLEALVDDVRAAGLPVDLRIEGTAVALPPGVDVSAYRVVQEALTNALRHAGGAHVSVVVRYRAEDVEVEVSDDGHGAPGKPVDGGRGLVGMRERVALFHGDLEAGPRPGGGFAVRARLPIGTTGG
jgi:signal transduction histidine kinase